MAARKPKAPVEVPVEETEGVEVQTEAPPVEKARVFRVTAPLVQAVVEGRPTQFRSGDILPADTSVESLDHLRAIEYVEEIDVPEAVN